MAAGRPSSYDPSYAEQAHRLCLLGAVDAELADFFDVSLATITVWKGKHPEFLASLKAGKEEADARVERSLYQRAIGYSHPAVKIMATPEGIVHEPYIEHIAPDTTACIFWLKNRRSDLWRDVKDLNVRKVESLTEEQCRVAAEEMIESARHRAERGAARADLVHDAVPAGLPGSEPAPEDRGGA